MSMGILRHKSVRLAAVWGSMALGTMMLAGTASAQTEIKFSLEMFEGDNPEYNAAMRFKNYVESKSNGELKVRLFPGNQLGSARDTTEMVQQGTLEMAFPSDGALAGFYKPIQAWSIPYLFTSAPVAWEVMNSEFGRWMLKDIHDKTGMRALAFSQNGFRSFTNNTRPIITPKDMAGLKIRTMESPVYMELVKALGASPTPIAGSEVVMALKQGVVDGQENPPSVVYSGGAGDVQKYYTLNEHILGVHIIIASDNWFNSLSPSHQRIVTDAAQVMALTENLEKTEADWVYAQKLAKEKGMKIHVSTPQEKEQFRAAVKEPVQAYITQQVGKDLVDRLSGSVKAAEEKLYR
jgi:TRAP-type transport system periplasmic protein